MSGGTGFRHQLALDLYGQLIWAAWGERPYLVGSTQRGARDARDVDVRVMLSDAEYQRLLGPVWQEGRRHRYLPYTAQMHAWSVLGEHMTGLKIDFQVQRLSEANERYPDGIRNPIGFMPDSRNVAVPESEVSE